MSLPDFIPANATDCFALLDDRDADSVAPCSRLYTGHAGSLSCRYGSELPVLLQQMQQALRQGLHAVALFSYELGEDLHGIERRAPGQVVAEVLLFDHCARLSEAQVTTWLAERETAQHPAGIAAVRATVDEAEFNAAIARIHAYIEAGDSYQINYTYRLRFDVYGTPLALYRRLRSRQPVPYGALVTLPDGRTVLSLSPELFVRFAQGIATARPMKGTVRLAQQENQAVPIDGGRWDP